MQKKYIHTESVIKTKQRDKEEMKKMRSALFWDVTQHTLWVNDRSFGLSF